MPVKVTNLTSYKLSLPRPFSDNLSGGAYRLYPNIAYMDAKVEENIIEMLAKGQIALEDLDAYAGSVHGVPLANYGASVAPAALTDDETAGYAVGSVWVDVVAGAGYLCVDATAGAAVWKQITV